MPCLFRFALLATLFAVLAPAFAKADDGRAERVAFHNGRAVINGAIKGYQYVDYVFPAAAGESIKASLATRTPGAYFNLLAPGVTDDAMFVGQNSMENVFNGAGLASGDYKARVYMMRNEARRGKVARYRLTIEVGDKSTTNEKGPDFADGLTGGPDYWEVAGVGAGDSLSMRATPAPKGAVVAQLQSGATLKNLGCKNTRGQRWCRVEGDGKQGWVNGRYLREGAEPK